MLPRQGTMLVADEVYYNLYGKAILQGVYHGDLIISTNPSAAAQLIFYFIMEADISDPFKSLAVEVTLPENDPVRHNVLVFPMLPGMMPEGRTRIFYRHPLLIPNPILRPGRIDAKVIHESGEFSVGGPWITQAQTAPKPN